MHSSAVTRCSGAWERSPKILIIGASTKKSLTQPRVCKNPKRPKLWWVPVSKDVCIGFGKKPSQNSWKYSSSSIAHTNTLPAALSRTLSKAPVVAYNSSGQAHTRTEWDGTGHPSFSSNPGAQASRQDFDHAFSQICSKFIPEPTRQTKRGSA